MKTGELIKKANKRSLEKQDNNWLPLGQKVLKAGYRQTSDKELYEMLDILKHLNTYHHRLCCCSLINYVKEIIPEQPLQDIRKARNIGIKKFKVYWVKDKEDDPVILGFVGVAKFFITKW